MTDKPFREKSRDRRVAFWMMFGLVVLFGGLYVAGYVLTSDRLPRGTTVAGVSIGGQTPAQARQTLTDALRDKATAPIPVTADGASGSIDPEAAGLALDVDASVEQAGAGRSWAPARMWDYYTGGDDLDPVLAVDQTALGKAIDGFAAKVEQPAEDGSITFKAGQATPHFPSTGRALDHDAAASALQEAYLRSTDPVELTVTDVQPDVSEEAVHQAMDDFANPAMAAPVLLKVDGSTIVLRPEDYSDALTMKAQNGRLVPALDGEALLRDTKPAMRRFALAPVDATVALRNGRPTVVPGKAGLTFDPKQLTDQFLTAVVQRDDNRTVTVDAVVDRPDFTTADARKLAIKEVVSEFTTYYPHADYRNTNLGRAAHLINGTVLKPGETFSLNGTVGERTAENGFTKGFIISDGVFKEDFGGGVSQVATTTFNAAFFAGLEDVEHKPHSFYIDRYPVGREATVAWPSVDLKFKDDSPYGILIQAWIVPSSTSRSGEMHVRMWSTKYWDIKATASDRYNITQPETRHLSGEDCVPNDGYGGFDIDVYRLFYRHGSDTLDHKETMHTHYTPSDSVVCS